MKREFGPANRAVAALLAVIWLAAGTAALFIAVAQRCWWGLVLGGLTVGYGALWIEGRPDRARLRWPRRSR